LKKNPGSSLDKKKLLKHDQRTKVRRVRKKKVFRVRKKGKRQAEYGKGKQRRLRRKKGLENQVSTERKRTSARGRQILLRSLHTEKEKKERALPEMEKGKLGMESQGALLTMSKKPHQRKRM